MVLQPVKHACMHALEFSRRRPRVADLAGVKKLGLDGGCEQRDCAGVQELGRDRRGKQTGRTL